VPEPDALARARAAAAAAAGKGAEQIRILDLRGQTLITDFFVICTATSQVHMRAVREGVELAMAGSRHRLGAREGSEEAQWVLLDYGDVIVHLMSEERRAYYKLERMWQGAAEVPLPGPSG
jgi:ribosome-associated protein